MTAISTLGLAQILPDAVNGLNPFWIVVGAILLVVVILVIRALLYRRKKPLPAEPDLRIDLDSLHPEPPPESPRLEFFGLPVRLVVLVLAPAGRDSLLPPEEQRNDLFESIVPGFAEVVRTHQPLVATWPSQLSAQGFIHKYFQNVRLPGDRGRRTPWCSAAGIARCSGRSFLIGMTFWAARSNHFSEETIHHEGDWYRVLRVAFRS